MSRPSRDTRRGRAMARLAWAELLRGGLERVAAQPMLTAGLYLLAALTSGVTSGLASKLLLGDLLAGRPTPMTLDWGALAQLHHPRLLQLGVALAVSGLVWWLLIAPLLTAGSLARLAGRARFFRGVGADGPRLLLLRLLTALAVATLAVPTFYAVVHAHAAALTAADERWQLLAALGPLAAAGLGAGAMLAWEQQAQAARVDRRCDLTEALLRGLTLLRRRPLTLIMLVGGAGLARVMLVAAALGIATQQPGDSVALGLAQLAMLGRTIVGLWRLGAALELERQRTG
jgi:hypothetical protein